MGILLFLAAWAGEGGWSGSVGLTTAFVAGPLNPGTTTSTLDGDLTVGPTFNPSLDLALTLGAAAQLGEHGFFTMSWSVRRDVRFADTADDGFRPGTGSTSSATVLDTTEPVLAWVDPSVASKGRAHLVLSARAALPLSREALVCNPSWGGLGATGGLRIDLGPVTALSVLAGADRALHRYAAAPRGRCGVGSPTTDTLDGTVAPDAGPGFSTVPNPAWTIEQTLSLRGWHGIFGLSPAIAARPSFARAVTGATVGLRERIDRRQPADAVVTLDGTGDVSAARTPVVLAVPWSITGGYRFPLGRSDDALSAEAQRDGTAALSQASIALTLTLANQAPTLLYDAAARLRALPASTSATLQLTTTF